MEGKTVLVDLTIPHLPQRWSAVLTRYSCRAMLILKQLTFLWVGSPWKDLNMGEDPGVQLPRCALVEILVMLA